MKSEVESSVKLRPLLHGKIDEMNEHELQILHRALLRIEAAEMAAKITAQFAEIPDFFDRLDETIAAVRKEHPYQ